MLLSSLISLNSFVESFPSWHAARWRHLAQGRRAFQGWPVFHCPTCSNAWNLDLEGVSCMAQHNAVLHLGLRWRINRHRKPIVYEPIFCQHDFQGNGHDRCSQSRCGGQPARCQNHFYQGQFEIWILPFTWMMWSHLGQNKATLAEKESLLRVGWPTPERLYTQPDPMTHCEFCHVLIWKGSALHRSILILFD